MSEEPRPGTIGGLDRRVERLEGEMSEVRSEIKLLKLGQEHSHELMKAHFSTVEASMNANLAETKRLSDKFDTAALQGAQMIGDPTSTPAGRQIVERLTAIEHDKEFEHANIDTRVSALERRMYIAIGATAVLSLLVQLVGPYLLSHI